MHKFLYLILFPALFWGCTEKQNIPVKEITQDKVDEMEFQVDTLTIHIPGAFHELPIGNYSLSPDHPEIMCGFDGRNHQIEIFNFKSGLYTDSIPIPRKGPNSTTNVSSVFYQKRDSIFLLDVEKHRILIYNSSGEAFRTIPIDNEGDTRHPLFGVHAHNNNNECPIYFHQDRIYFTLRSTYKEGDYSIPLIGYYDFKNEEFGTLDISYPPIYQTGYFGFYEYINVSFMFGKIFVNFPVSGKIYVYDLDGKLLEQIDPGLDFPVAKPIPNVTANQIPDAMTHMDHLSENPLYHRLMPVMQGKYFIQNGREAVPADRGSTIFAFTIIYSHDFSYMYVIHRNLYPFSTGNDYFYYTLPVEDPASGRK